MSVSVSVTVSLSLRLRAAVGVARPTRVFIPSHSELEAERVPLAVGRDVADVPRDGVHLVPLPMCPLPWLALVLHLQLLGLALGVPALAMEERLLCDGRDRLRVQLLLRGFQATVYDTGLMSRPT